MGDEIRTFFHNLFLRNHGPAGPVAVDKLNAGAIIDFRIDLSEYKVLCFRKPLRAVVFLGEQYGSPCTTRHIAEATQVPNGYLSKVLQALSRGGLVRSRRGLHGGFELERPPADVSLLDVVQVVEPLRRVRSCPLELPEHADQLCPLHRRLDDALALIETCFKSTTVADLIADGEKLNPMISSNNLPPGRCSDRCSGKAKAPASDKVTE